MRAADAARYETSIQHHTGSSLIVIVFAPSPTVCENIQQIAAVVADVKYSKLITQNMSHAIPPSTEQVKTLEQCIHAKSKINKSKLPPHGTTNANKQTTTHRDQEYL